MGIFPKEREFILKPGEGLLVSDSPEEYGVNVSRFMEASGLGPDDFTLDPISKIPIPTRPESFAPRKAWAGVRPQVMWNPLFWLPQELAFGQIFINPEDHSETIEEPESYWIVRVCEHLVAMGLYNPETGMWADVLSSAGIDVDNPADIARVQQWMDGGDDPVLDKIDLAYFLPADDSISDQALDDARGYEALTLTRLSRAAEVISAATDAKLQREPDTRIRANDVHFLTLVTNTLSAGLDDNTHSELKACQEEAKKITDAGLDPDGVLPQIVSFCSQLASQVQSEFSPLAQGFEERKAGNGLLEITSRPA